MFPLTRLHRLVRTVTAAACRWPGPRMSNTEARAGFTLIEMMAVMTLVALVSALVFAFVPGAGRAGLKGGTMNSVALLRRERLSAVMTGRERHVTLDGEHRVLVGD